MRKRFLTTSVLTEIVLIVGLTLLLRPTSAAGIEGNPGNANVAQQRGATSVVAVQGHYAYMDVENDLVILDVSNPTQPTLAGESTPFAHSIKDIYVAGNYAYMTNGDGGLRVIDVSEPATPMEMGSYRTGYATGIHVLGDHAYVAADYQGLRILDVSDTTAPTEVGYYNPLGHVQDVYVVGDPSANPAEAYAYVADMDIGLRIVDVSDPTAPVEVAVLETPHPIRDIYVSDNYAFIAVGRRVMVLDVSDPSSPIVTGQGPEFSDPPESIYVAGTYAYVAVGRFGLRVLDVTDPATPVETGFYDTRDHARKVYVAGDYAYVAAEQDGLRVINISNPAAPVEAGAFTTQPPSYHEIGEYARAVTVRGNYAYVGNASRLDILNISAPEHLAVVGQSASLPDGVNGVYVVDDYAYVAADEVGLRVLDISDPTVPVEVGACDTPWFAQDVYVTGNYAYIADSWSGLQIVDVSDPSSPTWVAAVGNGTWSALNIYVAGDYAYVVAGDSLRVVEVSEPTAPVELGMLEVPGHSGGGIYVTGNHAYVGTSLGLWVVDVSDPISPASVGLYETPGGVGALYIVGDFAYVANWRGGGVRVLDISDPTVPLEVGGYQAAWGASEMQIAGQYAYVAAGDAGLQVLDVSDPVAPHALGTAPGPSWNVEFLSQTGGPVSDAVVVQGGYAYLGVGPRLVILSISDPAYPRMVGQSPVFPDIVEDIYLAGNHAYVAAGNAGLRVLDVSSAIMPVEIGAYETPGRATRVRVTGHYAYVATSSAGLRMLDISDPATPAELGSYETSDFIGDLHITGDYAYVATARFQAHLRVLDISNPAAPVEVGTYTRAGTIWDVHVADTYAYLVWGHCFEEAPYQWQCSSGLEVLDVSNPATPLKIGTYHLEERNDAGRLWAQGVYVTHDKAIIAAGHSLQVVDVSDPTAPVPTMTYETSGWARGVYAIGDPATGSGQVYAYVTDAWLEGLQVVDISNGSLPRQVGFYKTVKTPNDVDVIGNYAYMGCETRHEELSRGFVLNWPTALQLVDISDPKAPMVASTYFIDGGEAHGVDVTGGYAYVASDWAGLRVIDVSDPITPAEVGLLRRPGGDPSFLDVLVTGDYAYVTTDHWSYDEGATAEGGLWVVDVSDPATPVEVGVYETADAAPGLDVAGDYAYVAADQAGLRVVDVSDPTAPVEVGAEPGLALAVDVVGAYAYVAAGEAGLRILDISDPSAPVRVGAHDTPSRALDVQVVGHYAYVAAGEAGLRIFDISEPATLRQVGVQDRWPVEEVHVVGPHVYASAKNSGLFVFRFIPPTSESVTPFGGSLASPFDRTTYTFAAGTFTDTVTITHAPQFSEDVPSTGSLAGIDHFFEVSAVYSSTGRPARPTRPYTVTVRYAHAEKTLAIESTLALYTWDGYQWVREPTSIVDTAASTVTATPTHFGLWAVLGKTHRAYLPLTAKQTKQECTGPATPITCRQTRPGGPSSDS